MNFNKMKSIKHIYLLSVLALLFSCKKENRCDCIKRTGSIIIEERTIPTFSRIRAEDNVDVFISYDTVQEIKVEAGKNIVPLIETVVEDGVLVIRNKNRCNWTRSYKKEINVYIKTPSIRWISNEGTANIKGLNTLPFDTLDIQTTNSGDIDLVVNNYRLYSHIFGSGDIRLSGNVTEHLCNIGGTSYMYAKDLKTSYTYIDTHTIGPSEVSATDNLVCKIERKGNVYCYGTPTMYQQIIVGTGQLIFK